LKRIRDRQRRNLYTLEDEKEDTYARLAQAGRRGALIRQYEAEHPDDPRVAAKRVGEEKKERDIRQHKRRMFLRKTGLGAKRALSGTSRLIRANVRLALSTIITSLVAGLGIASKIYRSVTDIGDTVRRRAMSDAALNFDPGTIHAWEAYAGNRGWDKNALAHAASEVYGAFGNIENFSKTNLRLWTFLLGSGVGDLTSMLTNDGDANVETIMSAIMNRLIRNIDAGHASVVKPNVSPSQAYAEIVSQLSGLSPALGLMLSYYDSEFKLAQSKDRTITKYSDWKIKGSDGVLYDMSDWSNFYRVSQFDPVNKLPEMPDRPIKDTATQQANEQFTNAAGAFITLRDDLLQDIAINTVNTFNAVRSIISEFLRPFFPAFAAKEAERAAIINDQSRATLETMLPVWAGRAAVAAKEQGYTGDMTVLMDAVSQSLHKNTFDPLLNLGLEDTTLTGLLNNFDLLAAYAQGLNYQRQLDEQKNRDKRAILVTAELVSEAARSAVQQLFTIGGYRLKHEYSDKGSPYALDVDYVLNPEEARKRADDRAKQEEQERTRQAQIAEETGRKSAKLRDELVDASRVSMGMLEKEAGKAVKQGLVPRLTGGDSYDLMRHFNYIAGLAEKAISGPFAEHSINVNGGLVSMREYGYTNLLIPAIKKVMQSKAFTNYQLQGSEYASIINIVSDYINYFSSHDMEDMAEQFSAELYVPLLEFLAAMPRADEATRAAMKRIPIEPPGFIPERFREIIDNFWNTYSGAMALESYTRRQNASRQAGSILDSNVLTYRDLHQNGYEAVIANVISAHIGSVLAQVEDSNDISAVLSKYLGAAGEGNHVDVSSADNGSAILNIYLDNKLKYTTELKNMFERGVRFSKRIDTMYDLNGVKPTR
jgi:hypothetical protein